MILQRGGEVRPKLHNKGLVKFIIAPMLTNSKFKEFERYKVVREAWIVESCREGRLLDWRKWKLQVQGGWEQGSRKGMEGYLNSTVGATQKPSSAEGKKEEEDEEEEEEEEEEQIEDPGARGTMPAIVASTQSLFRPGGALLKAPPQPRLLHTPPSVPTTIIPDQAADRLLRSAPNPTPPLIGNGEKSATVPTKTDPPATTKPQDLPSPFRLPKAEDQLSVPRPPAWQVAKAITLPSEEVPVVSPFRQSATSVGQLTTALAKAKTPARMSKAEATWEFYHTKESNEDAARLMKDQEWRLKNTAERGNEGGFIDGYYQNSR
jgi:DNA repair protein REV1